MHSSSWTEPVQSFAQTLRKLKHFHAEILGFEIVGEVYRVRLPARRHNCLQTTGHLLGTDCFDTPGTSFRVFVGHMKPRRAIITTASGPGHPKALDEALYCRLSDETFLVTASRPRPPDS